MASSAMVDCKSFRIRYSLVIKRTLTNHTKNPAVHKYLGGIFRRVFCLRRVFFACIFGGGFLDRRPPDLRTMPPLPQLLHQQPKFLSWQIAARSFFGDQVVNCASVSLA